MSEAEVRAGVGEGHGSPQALNRFLADYLGGWPQAPELTVIGAPVRLAPSWDGTVRDVVGVAAGRAGVLSVAPQDADAVRRAVRSWDDVPAKLAPALGRPHARTFSGVFRWSTAPADLPDAGEWVDAADPRIPEWLRPFGGQALVAFAGGRYAAGVGVKRHNSAGMEISVGTQEEHRGRGLAARLVAQAARRIIAAGAVPVYLHDPANTGSDRTAARAGFPDLGWRIVSVWEPEPGAAEE